MYSLGVCGGRSSTWTSDSARTSTGWRAARGISRAALIRGIIGRVLGIAGDDLADDLAALDESFGVLAELTGGMRSPERREVGRLLASLSLKPVTIPVARQAGALMRTYRASHQGIGLGDYLIAATAQVFGLSWRR